MNLENKVENEITIIDAAKIIMPYLKVNPVKPKLNNKLKYVPFFLGAVAMQSFFSAVEGVHTAHLFFTSRERYQEHKKYCKEEKQNRLEMDLWQKKKDEEFEELLSDNGISEEAFKIAHFAGDELDAIIFHAENYNYVPIEIIKSKPKMQWVTEYNAEIGKNISTSKEIGMRPLEVKVLKENFGLMLEAAINLGIHIAEDHFYGRIPGYPKQFNNVELDMASVKKELLDRIYQKCSEGKPLKLLENVEVRIEQEYVYMQPWRKKELHKESE